MKLWRQGSSGHARQRARERSLGTVLAVVAAALAYAVAAFASGSAPTAVTQAPSKIGLTTATLAGTVNPHGSTVTECVFRYGTTPALEKSAPCSYSPGHGVTPVPVEAAVSGLSETTAYHVKLFARNANGESLGEERSLHDAARPRRTRTPTRRTT